MPRVFSPNRRDEFLDYLDGLRAAVPDEHIELVREVYGENWLEPFTGVFDAARLRHSKRWPYRALRLLLWCLTLLVVIIAATVFIRGH